MKLNGLQVAGDGYPGLHPEAMISDAVHIHDGIVIGARTKVWQFANVIRGAKVGSDCSIAAGAIVDGSRIGDRCIISHCAFIDPGMVIGNDVFIGPFVALCNDAWPRTDKTGWFNMDDLTSGKAVVTWIEDGASVGAHATVLPGLVIGAGAMISAGAVVDKDVPALHLFKRDGTMVVIDPARLVRRMRRAR